MDAFQIEQCIGKLEDSVEVSQLLKELGVTKKLKPNGAEDTVVKLESLGLRLTFQRATPKTSQLKLLGVQFVTEGNGFKAYAGALPWGLKWSDSKQDVYAKLGKPMPLDDDDDDDDEDIDMRIDNWVKSGVQATVKYSLDHSELKWVILAIPYEEYAKR